MLYPCAFSGIDIVKVRKMHLSDFVRGENMTHGEYRGKHQISSEQADKELFSAYCNYVYTIVFNRLRSCVSREDIDECVCDVFADVFRSYDSTKELSGDMSGFIGTVARRIASDVYRKQTAGSGHFSLDDENIRELPSEQDIVNEAEQKERRRVILQKITELGEPDSTIIIQKYYYGRSAKEIAAMVSLTPENIRVRCGRAVRRLKELLEKEDISL